MTEQRIRAWIAEYGVDHVYVSFSGGKDSTVLLDIVRNRMGYNEIPAVFVDTGLEYPEIREFVKTFDNVVWLKPDMNFKQVIEKYGYPFISKEVSECVAGARKYLKSLLAAERERESCLINTSTINYVELANMLNERMLNRQGGSNQRLAIMLGMLTKDKNHPIQANIPKKDLSNYSQEKYKYFLDAPFEISNKCCNVMKKKPVHKYAKETGRKPITAQMAAESRLRTQKWLQNGCNGFHMKEPISNPMAFWTEQDILEYIYIYDIPICSVYGKIVRNQDYSLKTTGCHRTGCMFCGYGCQLEKPGEGRFESMKLTHPKQYEWIMKPWKEGGLGYKDIINWINEHGNLNIRY